LAVILYKKPRLKEPYMFVGWPGIGNIGIITIDTLRQEVEAEELGEIEPWDFFYPNKVIIRDGILDDMHFPSNRFYYKKSNQRDLLFFIGEEQPSAGNRMYAAGAKAYEMANHILDVAERFHCKRIYTSGAAVSLTHHSVKPKVWAVATTEALLAEARTYYNTILMSQVEARGNQGNITGLNGLLLGAAKKRGFEGVCLMGEIPDYLSRVPFPYPKASQSVLEVISSILNIPINYSALEDMSTQMENVIANVYSQFPPEIRERIEQRKIILEAGMGSITEEDEKWIKEHIDEFFKKGDEM